MRVNHVTGLLNDVRYIASPNCDARPAGTDIDLVVIHGISLPPGEYGGPFIDALFTNTLAPEAHPYFQTIHHLRVSAHVVIQRTGVLTQFVPFPWRAWHAGESCFEERTRCNDFSIGIELEGSDAIPYTGEQYDRLAEVLQALMLAYPRIDLRRIVGHSAIAPGRKTDPGAAFDWQRLRGLLVG